MDRIVRIDLRRGIAPLGGLLVFGATVAVLLNEAEMWSGRWSALAGYLRVLMIVLVPLTMAVGAWQGGRDRRRRIGELLASTPRPPWRRAVAAWAAVAMGVLAGYLVAGGIMAVLVGRVATYAGGGWWWLVAVSMVALGAAAAIGLAAGTLLPSRLTAPILGLAGYVVIGALMYGAGGQKWLSPALDHPYEGRFLPLGDHVAQAAWFAALGVTALTLAGSRRLWPALVPAAVAAVLAVVIVAGPDDRWKEDASAREPVCVEGEPRVCATRDVAFVIDDFQAVAGRALAVYDGVDGLPDTLHAVTDHRPATGHDAAVVTVRPYLTLLGGLAPSAAHGASLRTDLVYSVLPDRRCDDGAAWPGQDVAFTAADVAVLWAGEDLTGDVATFVDDEGGTLWYSGAGADPATRALADELRSWPRADQLRWLERYVVAGEACDAEALGALLAELR